MGLFDIFKKKTESTGLIMYGTGKYNISRPADELFNSALWSCVINLARLYATLPLHVYKQNGEEDRKRDTTSIVAEVLRNPNPYMTAYEFRFAMGFNFEMHGEACALIQRSTTGRPIALYPVSPNSLVASWDGGRLTYTLAPTGEKYNMDDVLIIKNTPVGYGAGAVLDPIYYAASDIELEQKCKDLQKEYFTGASVVGNLISVPRNTPVEQRDEIRKQFSSRSGFRNYILDEQIKLTPIQIQNADIAKLSEAQAWNASEVARRFNVPPFFIGDTTGTYNNSEQQGLQMVIYCLNPRVSAWESAINSALCERSQYVEFNLDGLLRGDHASRSAFYHNGIMDGWLSINDVRKKENLPRIGKEGDVHFFPMNYGSLKDVADGKFANQGTNIWDLPVSESAAPIKPLAEAEIKEERRRKDLAYISEAQKPAKSNRQKIESLIRKHLKASIEELKRLIATGSPAATVISDFEEFLKTQAKDLSPQYKAIYLDILQKMVPVIQKETGKDDEVSDTAMDKFAKGYADSVANRVSGRALSTAKQSIETEDFDASISDMEANYPIEQSEEEVNKSSNAFSVFLFQQLHISVMHVVAAVNSCSFCNALDGKTTSVEGYIIRKGDDVDTDDGVRHIERNYGHPPFHGHCKCSVAPGEGY